MAGEQFLTYPHVDVRHRIGSVLEEICRFNCSARLAPKIRL